MAAAEEHLGAWMKKRVDPSLVDGDFKDGYVDMLADRRKAFNDLPWALKKVPKTATYKYKHERNYEQLNKDVLHSDRVAYVIEQVTNSLICYLFCLFFALNAIFVIVARKFY